MGTDNCAINDEVLHISVINKILMHLFPYAFITPSGEAFVDAVPVAIVLRKQSPRSTASCHPEYAFNEAAALGFLTNVEIWT